MSEDKIDDVARAIAIALTPDWNFGIHWAMNAENRRRHVASARAAIEAMREPTDAMATAGEDALEETQVCYSLRKMGLAAWRAMIDAALKSDAKN